MPDQQEKPGSVAAGSPDSAVVSEIDAHGTPTAAADETRRETPASGLTSKPPCEAPAYDAVSLRNEDRRLAHSSSISDDLQGVSLTPQEGFILSRIDGKTAPRDILAVSPLPEEETVQALVALLEAGFIRLVEENKPGNVTSTPIECIPPATPARPPVSNETLQEVERLLELARSRDYRQLLAVGCQAGPEEIKRAYQRNVFRYHPDRYPQGGAPDFHVKLSRLLAGFSEALDALSKARERTPAEAAPTRPSAAAPSTPAANAAVLPNLPNREDQARVLFVQAERVFLLGDYWQTIQFCRQAIALFRQKAEYHHLLGLALAKNKHWRKEAEGEFAVAAELDPSRPEHFGALAALYESEGLHLRAERMLERARALDPQFSLPTVGQLDQMALRKR